MGYLYSKPSPFLKRHASTAMALMAVAGFAAGVATPQAAEAGVHSWQFKYSNNLEANVTLAFAGALTPATTFNITGITGYIGAVSGVGGFNITGLSSYAGASNQFQYNPTLSPNDPNAFFTDVDGISFTTDETASWNIYNTGSGFAVANAYTTDSASTVIKNGSIIVAGPPAPPQFSVVPGPLPIFGAAAAFGMSRRLRRRVLTSQLR
jgi:hypothetical protein